MQPHHQYQFTIEAEPGITCLSEKGYHSEARWQDPFEKENLPHDRGLAHWASEQWSVYFFSLKEEEAPNIWNVIKGIEN